MKSPGVYAKIRGVYAEGACKHPCSLKFNSDEGRTWLMHLCISTDPSGSTVLYFGLDQFVLPPHLSAIVGSRARPNELPTRKLFGVC